MAAKGRQSVPPEARALFEQARNAAQGNSAPRKHHLVPASYLRRWQEADQIRVTEIDEHRSFLQAPEKAARETDFYRLEHDELDPTDLPPLLFETLLGRLENSAKQVIDGLVGHGRPELIEPQLMAEFTWHLSFQITRGRAFRARQRAVAAAMGKVQLSGITDDMIRQRLRASTGSEPTEEQVTEHRRFLDLVQDGSVVMTPPEAMLIGLAAAGAQELGQHLLFRNWVIYSTPPILLTCDEPVVLIAGPGMPRDEVSGVAVAGVIAFPLDPQHLLVMFHPGLDPAGPLELDHVETIEMNREILAAAHRFAFERPTRRVAERLNVPAAPSSASLVEGPLPGLTGERGGQVFRTYSPNRWSKQADPPPWPVARWWR